MICRYAQTRTVGQLGGEGEVRSHLSTAEDHIEGAPSRAPFICKEPTGFGR